MVKRRLTELKNDMEEFSRRVDILQGSSSGDRQPTRGSPRDQNWHEPGVGYVANGCRRTEELGRPDLGTIEALETLPHLPNHQRNHGPISDHSVREREKASRSAL